MISLWQEMARASDEERREFEEFARESWTACVVTGHTHWLTWMYYILPVWWGYSGRTPVWFL